MAAHRKPVKKSKKKTKPAKHGKGKKIGEYGALTSSGSGLMSQPVNRLMESPYVRKDVPQTVLPNAQPIIGGYRIQ